MAVALATLAIVVACGNTPGLPRAGLNTPVRGPADLTCSLPVSSGSQAGFIDFPSGKFRADLSAPDPRTHFGLTYSFGAHRWVTTAYSYGYDLLSPDGRYFVEAQGPPMYSGSGSSNGGATEIYLRDVNTMEARKVGSVPGRARVFAYRSDGIYLDQGAVLRFDPATGHTVTIRPKVGLPNGSTGWFWTTSDAVWGSLLPVPNQSDANPVVSMSLADGTITEWYRSPTARSVSIVGFVKPDEPLLIEFNVEPYDHMTGIAFSLLTGRGVVKSLTLDPSISPWGVTDRVGVWLASPGRVWLYSSDGLIPMADISGALGDATPRPVGPCR